jgi:hypothetical protein
LSGIVTESSRKSYIGRRMLLVVLDGDSVSPPLRDKLTFGFYRTAAKDWIATDMERPEEGIAPTWVAMDLERPEDVGILSQKSEEVTCQSFPISSYYFIKAKLGKGNVRVNP